MEKTFSPYSNVLRCTCSLEGYFAEEFEKSFFLFTCFYCCDYYFLNDYFTSFYAKHFEVPLFMKCAI